MAKQTERSSQNGLEDGNGFTVTVLVISILLFVCYSSKNWQDEDGNSHRSAKFSDRYILYLWYSYNILYVSLINNTCKCTSISL